MNREAELLPQMSRCLKFTAYLVATLVSVYASFCALVAAVMGIEAMGNGQFLPGALLVLLAGLALWYVFALFVALRTARGGLAVGSGLAIGFLILTWFVGTIAWDACARLKHHQPWTTKNWGETFGLGGVLFLGWLLTGLLLMRRLNLFVTKSALRYLIVSFVALVLACVAAACGLLNVADQGGARDDLSNSFATSQGSSLDLLFSRPLPDANPYHEPRMISGRREARGFPYPCLITDYSSDRAFYYSRLDGLVAIENAFLFFVPIWFLVWLLVRLVRRRPGVAICFTAGAMVLLTGCASGPTKKKEGKISVPEETLSPNGRYGVTVPVFDFDKPDSPSNAENTLVDAHSRRALALILGEPGFDRSLNHRSKPLARWSSDSSMLLWTVREKWSPGTLALLKLENDQVQWQADVLTLAQQAILTRAREADPKKYAAAKRANEGSGSAYPEGFTIDVQVLDPISLPLHVRAALTSNPKGIEWMPTIESSLDALIDEQGKFVVTNFKLGHASWHNSY